MTAGSAAGALLAREPSGADMEDVMAIRFEPGPGAEALLLCRTDIARIIARVGRHALMDELLERLGDALATVRPTEVTLIPRTGFAFDGPAPGVIEWMPLMRRGRHVTLKMVSEQPSNPSVYGLPTVLSTISVYDVPTGRLVALADGAVPTALRTGAASALATRALARPDARTLGVFGCGAQAVTQVHALSRVVSLREVLFHDVDARAAASFRRRTAFLDLDVRQASPEDIQSGSDVICTATTVRVGAGPVFEDRGLREWLHVNAVGADLPGRYEVPLTLLERSLVCPDFLEQARIEGECQRLRPEQIGPCLGEVLADPARFADRRHGPTVFDSTGLALEDDVTMQVLVRHATRLGLGERLVVENLADDPLDPYATCRERRGLDGEGPLPAVQGLQE